MVLPMQSIQPGQSEISLLCYIAREGTTSMLRSLLVLGLDLLSSPFYHAAIVASAGASASRVGAGNLFLILNAVPAHPVPSPFFSEALTAAARALNLPSLQLLISTQRCRCNALFSSNAGNIKSTKGAGTPRKTDAAGETEAIVVVSEQERQLRRILDMQLGAAIGAAAASSSSSSLSSSSLSASMTTIAGSLLRPEAITITCGLDLLRLPHAFDPPLQLFFDETFTVLPPPPLTTANDGSTAAAKEPVTITVTRCPALDSAAKHGHFAACCYLSELHKRTPPMTTTTTASNSSSASSTSSSSSPPPLYSSSFVLNGCSQGLHTLRCYLEGASLDPTAIHYAADSTTTTAEGPLSSSSVLLEGEGSVLWHALRLFPAPLSMADEACLDLLLTKGAKIRLPDSIARFVLAVTGQRDVLDSDGASLPHLPLPLFITTVNPGANALMDKLRSHHGPEDPHFALFMRYLSFLLVESTRKWREYHRKGFEDLLGPPIAVAVGEAAEAQPSSTLLPDPAGGEGGSTAITTPRRDGSGTAAASGRSNRRHASPSPSASHAASFSPSDPNVTFRPPSSSAHHHASRSRIGSVATAGAGGVGGSGNVAVDLGVSVGAAATSLDHHRMSMSMPMSMPHQGQGPRQDQAGSALQPAGRSIGGPPLSGPVPAAPAASLFEALLAAAGNGREHDHLTGDGGGPLATLTPTAVAVAAAAPMPFPVASPSPPSSLRKPSAGVGIARTSPLPLPPKARESPSVSSSPAASSTSSAAPAAIRRRGSITGGGGAPAVVGPALLLSSPPAARVTSNNKKNTGTGIRSPGGAPGPGFGSRIGIIDRR